MTRSIVIPTAPTLEHDCLEWASIGTAIAPQGSLWRVLLYSLKTALFSRSRVGSASE